MAGFITLNIREANLLRKRLQHLLDLRKELLEHPDQETVHDLRVASRRAREVLDYMQNALPPGAYKRMRRPAKNITSRLGELRETEVNLKLSENLRDKQLIPPLAAELLLHSLAKRKRKLQKKMNRQMKPGNFGIYEKFLNKLKASRLQPPAGQEVMSRRAAEFYAFELPSIVHDEQLHELRIHTKKFRYALEIYNRLKNAKLGRFILRLKHLQELLGDIHDLYVFSNLISVEAQNWNAPGLKIIPEALDHAIQVVTQQKEKLYPRARSIYERVLEHTPEEIRPIPRKEVHAADSTPQSVVEPAALILEQSGS
jgi:CHAD domain-containing protein